MELTAFNIRGAPRVCIDGVAEALDKAVSNLEVALLGEDEHGESIDFHDAADAWIAVKDKFASDIDKIVRHANSAALWKFGHAHAAGDMCYTKLM